MGQTLQWLLRRSGEALGWAVLTILGGEMLLGIALGIITLPILGFWMCWALAMGIVDLVRHLAGLLHAG